MTIVRMKLVDIDAELTYYEKMIVDQPDGIETWKREIEELKRKRKTISKKGKGVENK